MLAIAVIGRHSVQYLLAGGLDQQGYGVFPTIGAQVPRPAPPHRSWNRYFVHGKEQPLFSQPSKEMVENSFHSIFSVFALRSAFDGRNQPPRLPLVRHTGVCELRHDRGGQA